MRQFNVRRRKSVPAIKTVRQNSQADQLRSAVMDTLESRRLLAAEFLPQASQGLIPQSFDSGLFAIDLADMNRDGINDVVTIHSPNPGDSAAAFVHVGVHDGNGGFSLASTAIGPSLSADGIPATFSIADLNGDGNLDVVAARFNSPNLYILPGRASNTFDPTQTYALASGEQPRHVVTGDFNGDGRQDIAVSFQSTATIALLSQTASGQFNRSDIALSGPANSIAAGDLNGDGATDLAIGTATAVISYRNLDGPQFESFTTPATNVSLVRIGRIGPTNLPPTVIAQATNPNNASLDVIFQQDGSNTRSLLISTETWEDFKISDVDLDGLGDLVIARGRQGVIVYGLPEGTFSSVQTVFSGNSTRSVAVGNLNRDTAPDIISGNEITVFTYRFQQPPESLVVTTALDEDNGNARPNNGTGTSLREAFNYARTLQGNQTITFASSLGNANAVINVTGVPLVLDGLANPQVLTIRNTTGTITLRGDGTRSLFDVRFLGNLTLENLNITNFRASHSSGNGGVVHVAGFGTLNVSNSTFSGNSAPGEGSAIYSANSGVTFIRNSTFNGNTGASTIAIDSTSTFGLQNNTIVGNSGGVRAVAGTLGLRNNIITGNGSADLSVGTGTFAGDRNIVQTGPLGGLTNTINADPLVGPLTNNGGPTLTMRPSPASPALDAGIALPLVTTDQRGIARPQFAGTDIGSLELAATDFPGVTTPDGARWFLFGSVGPNQRIFRQAPGQSAVEVGGLGTSIGLQADGSVVVRDANGSVFTRVGSANGFGTEWSFRSSIVAGDGATWFLSTEAAGSDFNIYRWTTAGAPQFANGNGSRLVSVNGFAITQNAAGSVFLRVFSNLGFGTEWIVQSSAIAGDGAAWFVGVTTVGAEGPVFRWSVDGSVNNPAGSARELSRESGGTIVRRLASGAIFSKPGSANGVGGDWTQLPRVNTPDGAAWFLGTESATADQRIYRWANNSSTATEVGGEGTRLALQSDGSVLVRNSGGVPFHRVGSASGVGSDWTALPHVITADGATWFVSTEPSGANRTIYRWVGSNAPANTTGAALSLVISPNGDVRAINNVGQVFQAIGSSSGFSSNWRLLTESLVVTTILDENDFTSSANFGNGTSLREAIDFANASPGADTITFAPGLISSGQAVELAFGATGAGDDTALRVASDLTIDGGGATISYIGSAGRRLFTNLAGSTFTLRNLTLIGGNAAHGGNGGAVWTGGNLAIENVRFTGNTANGGGALHVSAGGSAAITNGQFDNNSATGTGGAIDNAGQLTINGSQFITNTGGEAGAIQSTGTLNISASTFTNNASNFNGGALRLFGTTTIDRSTFNGNTVANEGGALISFASLAVTNSTFANNGKNAVLLWDGPASLDHVTIAYNTDGGLLRVNADVTLRNSIVAGNAGFDQSGTLNAASSNNLLNISAAQARLGSLSNHGGPTATIELLPGSPAINAAAPNPSITIDQRGIARPQGSAPDLGAYERIATTASLTSFAFEFETRQAVVFNFDGDASVIFDRSSVSLINTATNQAISVGALDWNVTGTQATLLLTNQLPNGNYRVSVGSTSVDFHILAGDANRDRRVDFADLLVLARNYNQSGRTYSEGNFDYSSDGLVGFGDLLILAREYNGSLSADFARALNAASGLGRATASPARSMPLGRSDLATGSRSFFASGSVIGRAEAIGSGSVRRGEVVLV